MKRFICHHLLHRLIKIPFQQNDYASPFPFRQQIAHILHHLFFNYYATGFSAWPASRPNSSHSISKLFISCIVCLFVNRIYNYVLKSHWHLEYFSQTVSLLARKSLWIVLWRQRGRHSSQGIIKEWAQEMAALSLFLISFFLVELSILYLSSCWRWWRENSLVRLIIEDVGSQSVPSSFVYNSRDIPSESSPQSIRIWNSGETKDILILVRFIFQGKERHFLSFRRASELLLIKPESWEDRGKEEKCFGKLKFNWDALFM